MILPIAFTERTVIMKFTVSGGNRNAAINLTENKIGDILYLTVNMTLPSPEIPEPFFIRWNFSASDCCSTWNPSLLDIHGLAFEWGKLTVQSRLASWMPIQSLISKDGKNKLCIAVSDVDTPISIKTGLREELLHGKGRLRNRVFYKANLTNG